jgi:hypothetical protein
MNNSDEEIWREKCFTCAESIFEGSNTADMGVSRG